MTSAYEEAGVTVDSEGRRRGFRKAYELRLSSSSRASMSTSISEPAVDDPSSSSSSSSSLTLRDG